MTLFLFQKKVLFSARKKTEGKFHGKLTYDTIDVNVGDGLQANGNFIAPESGTYGFTFSGLTGGGMAYGVGGNNTSTLVKVYKDGNLHHDIFEGCPGHSASNINSSWMMKLAKGQVVHLEVTRNDEDEISVIFNGNLLMLDEWFDYIHPIKPLPKN